MFFDIGGGEIIGLAVLGLILFGPDRLPTIAVDAARFVRKLRVMYANASADLRSQVGDDINVLDELREARKIMDIRPKTILKDHLDGLIDPPVIKSPPTTPKIDPDAT
ncbi:Sec-independent protein translocase protein TatB [mine drainage metagenome]|uniref:Sec-independent protein translocase protein TatB n=1 Tax=mine drainage metagenome TaxID=410659 RepID=A0A1J5PW51_9ZZZZ